jgi:hypothetical protein
MKKGACNTTYSFFVKRHIDNQLIIDLRLGFPSFFQRKVKKCSNLVCKFQKSYYLCNPLFLCEIAYVVIIMIFS